jgi:hypothetical protein
MLWLLIDSLGRALGVADIAPTRHAGSAIVPQTNSHVRMEKAEVEIIWGEPCTISARFRMVNEGAEEEVAFGFPLPPKVDRAGILSPQPYEVGMVIDGTKAVVHPPASRTMETEWEWYTCKHTFKPGVTDITVTAELRPSLVYAGPFREALYYTVETGAKWAGVIGDEVVTIRFPGGIAKDQIISAKPGGAEVGADFLRWRFIQIEPKGKEFDIALTYIQPAVMRTLESLRAAFQQSPSPERALRLAVHLLVLGNAKSNSGFPPPELSAAEFARLLDKIAEGRDRATFVQHYHVRGENSFRASSSEWTEERLAIIRILADAGYRDDQSNSWFIKEAEELLLKVLREDPTNARAWNIYLISYWRFSFAAMGHWFGQTYLNKEQRRLIGAAARNCPKDEVIGMWLKQSKKREEKRDLEALHQKLGKSDLFKLEYPKLEYDYY